MEQINLLYPWICWLWDCLLRLHFKNYRDYRYRTGIKRLVVLEICLSSPTLWSIVSLLDMSSKPNIIITDTDEFFIFCRSIPCWICNHKAIWYRILIVYLKKNMWLLSFTWVFIQRISSQSWISLPVLGTIKT